MSSKVDVGHWLAAGAQTPDKLLHTECTVAINKLNHI